MQPTNKQETYLARWQNQRDYYSKKSAFNKRWHQSLQLFIGIIAVIVPVLLSLSTTVPEWIPGVLSLLVAIAAVVENVYHFGDNWRNFRQTLEGLKREKVFFDTGIEPYKSAP